MTPVNPGEIARIKFDEKQNKIIGIAGCNSFRAGYKMIRKAIAFEDVSANNLLLEIKDDGYSGLPERCKKPK